MSRILIVDDEAPILALLNNILSSDGHEVVQASNGTRAKEILTVEGFDLMISDVHMAPMDGLELLREAKALAPNMSVLMLTGHASVASSVEAMKQGAYDYVTKPFKPDELRLTVQRALEFQHLIFENDKLRAELDIRHGFEGMIAESAAMRKVCDTILKTAPTDRTVLITGESGTGKEVVAQTIHKNSVRKRQRFEAINCSAIPETLLESELFGYVKGAHNKADRDRDGLFKAANGGTLFLDEIGTMPMNLQAKLLRVLQEGEIRPLGSDKAFKVDVRVIAATNEQISKSIEDRIFREDLYYRLAVVEIDLPPLRERIDDIMPLALHFVRKLSQNPNATLQPSVRALLENYPWPGNVRELENAISSACIYSRDGNIQPDHLPQKILSQLPPSVARTSEVAAVTEQPETFVVKSLKGFLRKKEVEYIVKVLEHFNGDKDAAADALGISLATLYRKLPEPND